METQGDPRPSDAPVPVETAPLLSSPKTKTEDPAGEGEINPEVTALEELPVLEQGESIAPISATQLASWETYWKDHYGWLLEQGYQLRSRYSPEWIPSWKSNPELLYGLTEDSQRIPVSCRAICWA